MAFKPNYNQERRERSRVIDHAAGRGERAERRADGACRDRAHTHAPAGTTGRCGRKPSPHAGCEGRSLSGFIR